MISFLLKTLIAHLIGDFVFQPDHWIKDKQLKKAKSKFLYLHIIIHAALLFILFQFNIEFWIVLIFIPVSHYIIDILKIYLEKESTLDIFSHLINLLT